MADVTGGTPPTNASAFDVPGDLSDVYAHFGGPTMFAVANAAALPASGNWIGRRLMAQDTGTHYACTALPGTWTKTREDTGWTALTLAGAWVSFGAPYVTPRVRRIDGVVHVQGTIKNGALGTATTLPVGYRPSDTLIFVTASNAGVTDFRIDSAGVVSVANYYAGGTNAIVTMNVSFPVL